LRVELWGRHIEHPTITGCAQEGLVDTGRPSCCNDPDEHKAACPLLLFICRSVAIDACQRACFFSENTPKAVAAEIRSVLHVIDPNLAASDIQTMGQLESAASARRRFQTSLLIIFAAIALSLALVGMGGNLVLKLADELGGAPPPYLKAVVGISPLMDPVASAAALHEPQNRLHESSFLGALLKRFRHKVEFYPGLYSADGLNKIRTMR
jgi:hypothetical protein